MSSEYWRKVTCDNCGTEVAEDPEKSYDGENDALYSWVSLMGPFSEQDQESGDVPEHHFCQKSCLKTWVAEL